MKVRARRWLPGPDAIDGASMAALAGFLFGLSAPVACLSGHSRFFAILLSLTAAMDSHDGFTARMRNRRAMRGEAPDSLADRPGFVLIHGIVFRCIGSFAPSRCAAGISYAPCAVLRPADFTAESQLADRFVGIPSPSVSRLLHGPSLVLSVIKRIPVSGFLGWALPIPGRRGAVHGAGPLSREKVRGLWRIHHTVLRSHSNMVPNCRVTCRPLRIA